MKMFRILVVVGAVLVVAAGCSGEKEESLPSQPVAIEPAAQVQREAAVSKVEPIPFDGTVAISVRLEGGRKPLVIGATNLPNGTSLMVRLSRKQSSYSAQDKTTVSDGLFQAGPFSKRGAELNPGEYDIEVSSPLTALQPASVQAAFGEGGSNLRGPNTGPSPVGGTVIDYSTKVEIGSGTSVSLDAAARKQAESDLRQWRIGACGDSCRLVHGVAVSRGKPFDQDACLRSCLADVQGEK